jgi:Zn-dependent peptidase ImmA (M78 family)
MRADDDRLPVQPPQATEDSTPAIVAESARSWIGVTVAEQRDWSNDSIAYRQWRNALEAAGVLAFSLPLGSEEVRGFSAWSEHAPMVAINSTRDANNSSRVYTLAHELGHLCRRSDSACFDFIAPIAKPDPAAERWCEQFAAAFLLPNDDVRERYREEGGEPTFESVKALAAAFNVSLRAVAWRLIDLGLAPNSLYGVVEQTARVPSRPRRGGPSGETRPEKRLRQYGQATARVVVGGLRSGQIDELEATDLLRMTVPDLRSYEEALTSPTH